MFKQQYFQSYDGKLVHGDDGDAFIQFKSKNHHDTDQLLPVNVFTGVDPASSTRSTADYSTIVSVAVDKENNRYVLPYYRKRASPMKLANQIIEHFKILKPSKVRIESVGYQEMLREYIRQRCDDENMFIAGLEIKESPRNSKSARLETMEPYFAQKKVYMLDSMDELRDELLLYPRAKHDDLLDGLYYAMKNTYSPVHENSDMTVKTEQYTSSQTFDWMIS